MADNTTYVLALDLKNDPNLIAEYEAYHRKVWPEIKQSIYDKGIIDLQIYRAGNRMMMIMKTRPDFSFDQAAEMDAANPKVQEWETLMWKFQQPLPQAQPGEKWILMDKIFDLSQD